MRIVSLQIEEEDLRRIPARNRSEFMRAAIKEKLQRESEPKWRPKTGKGRKLLDLSNRFGGDRVDQAAIGEELRRRRGGLA